MKTTLEQKGLSDPDAASGEQQVDEVAGHSIYEPDLAEEMGLSREQLRLSRLELLQEGTDWVKKNNRVFLSVAACERLKKEAGADGTVLEKKGAGEDVVLKLEVVSVPRNVRVVQAKKNGGEMVVVRVRHNGNFMPGMEISARPGGEFADVYVLEGRCPRWRGRW